MPRKIAKISGIAVTTVGVIVSVLEINDNLENRKTINISGEWKVSNAIEKTSYSKYKNMILGYRIFINQQGNYFTATGEKCWENGISIPSQGKSQIILQGTVEGKKVIATFTEEGKMRKTSGSFNLIINDNHNVMEGIFKHTAANSSGTALFERID